MTQAQRRGACPSIDVPMQTGDGLLVRITPARGFFAPEELLAITAAAALCGNGTLEVSTRGNLQVRGLRDDTALAFRQRIMDAGIEVATGIPILVSPLAGLDPSEVRDASQLHSALRDQLRRSELADLLGPKVSVIIDGGGRLALSQLIADVRVKAVQQDGKLQWQLFVGGTEEKSKALGLADNDAAAISAIQALLESIAARGSLARGRDLDDGDLAAAMPFVEPSPTDTHTAAQAHATAKAAAPIGLLALRSGALAAGFGLPFGITSAATLTKFAQAVRQQGANEIRPAPGKVILVPGLDEGAAARLLVCAQALGLICNAGDPRASIVTCAGKPACTSAHIDTRLLARLLTKRFGNQLLGDEPVGDPLVGNKCIHISGCDKLCANPGSPRLEIIGTSDGCKVSASGRSEICSNSDDLPRMIARALQSNETSTSTSISTIATITATDKRG